MRRREFITLLGGAMAASPIAARAQQDGRIRRIGYLEGGEEADPRLQVRRDAMREALAQLGWIEGRNIRIDVRAAGDPDRRLAQADELVRLAPDVITVSGGPPAQALLQRTRTIPIVFTSVGDPVAVGLMKDIGRPEGNITGVTNLYQSIGGKWLELLKAAAPATTRVALVFAPASVNEQYFGVIDMAAEVLGLKVIRTSYGNAADLERAIDAFAAEPNGSLVLLPPPPSASNTDLIIGLALKHRLPSILGAKFYPAQGGLMGYGPDSLELIRTAASYIDRILRGTKISELPVQFPTKFELVINLKTARAIGLDIPPTLRALADEVIE